MRSDMSKVVIERPRFGHSDPSKKTKLRIKRHKIGDEYEDSPSRLPASKGRGTKNFTDVLGPLKKFLQSNVGQPWDKVYSELCEHLDRRKTTGRHVFQHLEDYIETNCFIGEDGEVYACTEMRGIERLNEQREKRFQWRAQFYVHPKSRVLCKRKDQQSAAEVERAKQLQRKKIERIGISFNQSYVRINGIWYIGDYLADESKPPYDLTNPPPYDWQRKELEEFGTRYWDGKRWMQLVGKRKCSQQELQKAGLKNANPAKRK